MGRASLDLMPYSPLLTFLRIFGKINSMAILLDEVKKLPVSERANLFLALEKDDEISEYLQPENVDEVLFAEIAQRDAAYKEGKIKLTTMGDLTNRLKARRDAL